MVHFGAFIPEIWSQTFQSPLQKSFWGFNPPVQNPPLGYGPGSGCNSDATTREVSSNQQLQQLFCMSVYTSACLKKYGKSEWSQLPKKVADVIDKLYHKPLSKIAYDHHNILAQSHNSRQQPQTLLQFIFSSLHGKITAKVDNLISFI